MKLYNELDVDLTFQNFGSQWLMIMRGEENDILLAFNGMWNYGATSGEIDFTDHAKTVAKFWSDEKKMLKYFKNRFWIGHNMTEPMAIMVAGKEMEKLRAERQTFINFNQKQMPDGYNMGTSSAERPDSDFRDKVIVHAFRDQ